MTISVVLSTGSLFNFDLDTVLALAGEAGYDGVELVVDWRRETQDPDHLTRLVSRHNHPILAVHSPFSPMLVPGWPDQPITSVKASVKLAETIGAQLVVVHPPERWVRLQALMVTPARTWKFTVPLPLLGPGELGQWLVHQLPEFQNRTRVKVAIENMPARRFGPFRLNAHHFSTAGELSHFQYLTLDTTHVGTRDWDLLSFYRELKPRVAHIHLSNFNGREHQLPDRGWLPLNKLICCLVEDGFDGLISLELSPLSLQAKDSTSLRQNLVRSLQFCRNALSIKAGTCDD